MLKYNLKYNDGAFVKLAYEAAQKEDLDAFNLDNECNA
jgi:urease accessory protein